jgi:RNA polymerase sigma factor (TIGR02999 family)
LERRRTARARNREQIAVDLTTILRNWEDPDPSSREELMRMAYEELHRLAASHMRNERPGHTFTPTVLVNELYLRISKATKMSFDGRRAFFAYASSAMRHILVDYARQRQTRKRGGDVWKVELPASLSRSEADIAEVLAVNAALEKLAELDAPQARIVEFRYFAGLSVREIAELTGTSEQDVDREWRLARSWLKRRLKAAGD